MGYRNEMHMYLATNKLIGGDDWQFGFMLWPIFCSVSGDRESKILVFCFGITVFFFFLICALKEILWDQH